MQAVTIKDSGIQLMGEDPLSNKKGMYRYIKSPEMTLLLDVLSKMHTFAKDFNANVEQRTVLMKAGRP